MPLSQLPALLSAWLTDITAALDRRSAPRLLLLLVGALFAKGRRTVTSWFRAADITTEFRLAYNALWAVGRQADALAYRLLCLALKPLMRRLSGDHVLFAIDDTPTSRYGPKVQAAGIHHNPTPGPAGEKVRLRSHLGHAGLAGSPPGLGYLGLAIACSALRPSQGRWQIGQALP